MKLLVHLAFEYCLKPMHVPFRFANLETNVLLYSVKIIVYPFSGE
jgi:hypothetical protein